jgi:phage-related protein (TIGR01555 family)
MKKSRLFHKDGWVNLLSGLGKRFVDKSQETSFGDFPILSSNELTAMWVGEGVGKRIVSVVADDILRAGFEITGDDDGYLMKELKRLKVNAKINEAICWTRLYGGALVVVMVRDGGKLSEPIGSRISEVESLRVYPITRVPISAMDICEDPESRHFEEIEIFPITKLSGEIFQVHSSRCLVFKGEVVPPDGNLPWVMRYWGMSCIQPIYDQLRTFGGTFQSVASLMQEFIIGVYKLSNLAEIVSENNVDAVYNRMEIIHASKSMLNAILIGEDEDFRRDVAGLAGLPEVLDKFIMLLSGVSGIPVSRLFGQQSGGLNNKGEADTRNYYDMVMAAQDNLLHDPLLALCQMVNKGIPKPISKDALAITFNPVWEPSQAELIDMRNKQANTDSLYIQSGVLSPQEVAEGRFEGGYSFETAISVDRSYIEQGFGEGEDDNGEK